MSSILPSLTIMLICWNHEKYLEQCIASLANQTDSDFKVVFLDNHSTDKSYSIAQDLFIKHQIDAVSAENLIPQSLPKNCNVLLDMTSTDLVCLLSTDDWYAPGYVAAMKDAFADNPDLAWAYPSIIQYDEINDNYENKDDSYYKSGNLSSEISQLRWNIGFLGICYRRDNLVDMGAWDGNMIIEDNDLLFRLSSKGNCLHVSERLVYYRITAGAMSRNPLIMSSGWEKFFEKHRNMFVNPQRILLSYNRTYFSVALSRGHYKSALTLFGRCARNALRASIKTI